MDEVVKYLKALVYLQAQSLGEDGPTVKAEILLARAGLQYKEIAEVLGKNEMAVAKSVNRAKHASKKRNDNE